MRVGHTCSSRTVSNTRCRYQAECAGVVEFPEPVICSQTELNRPAAAALPAPNAPAKKADPATLLQASAMSVLSSRHRRCRMARPALASRFVKPMRVHLTMLCALSVLQVLACGGHSSADQTAPACGQSIDEYIIANAHNVDRERRPTCRSGGNTTTWVFALEPCCHERYAARADAALRSSARSATA